MIYTELVKALRAYLETDFPDANGNYSSIEQLNAFIKNAEQRIYNAVNLPAAQFYTTIDIPIQNKRYFVPLPIDTLSVNSVSVKPANGSYVSLLPKDYSYLNTVFDLSDTITLTSNTPKYYALYDAKTLVLAPYPNIGAPHTVNLAYFMYPTSIVTAENGKTWLGDNFESVLLYGSILEGATFIQAESDMLSLYISRYQEALQELKQLADNKDRSDWYRNSIVPPMNIGTKNMPQG